MTHVQYVNLAFKSCQLRADVCNIQGRNLGCNYLGAWFMYDVLYKPCKITVGEKQLILSSV